MEGALFCLVAAPIVIGMWLVVVYVARALYLDWRRL